ncbi:MAG TPA: FKBP-type peptidyl-prolyl cis-trans isomerase N-terminal domain-containing protein [Candidatus Binatia bacterium]
MHPKRTFSWFVSCALSPTLAALGCALVMLGCAKSEQPPAKSPQPVSEEERTSYALGVHVGSKLRASGVEVDVEQVLAGFADALDQKTAEKRARLDAIQIARELERIGERTRAANVERARAARREVEGFFAENRAREGVIELPSGVQYRIVADGDQPPPALGDRITIEYEGRLLDGAVFDTSRDRFAPTIVRLARTPRAWREVLPLVPGGATVELWVPPDPEPTEHPTGLVPPGEPVVFTLRVTAIDRHRNPDLARVAP